MLSSGVISYSDVDDYPGLVEIYGKCYYEPDGYDAHLFHYMDYFDAEGFNAQFLNKCRGNNHCTAHLSLDHIKIPEA